MLSGVEKPYFRVERERVYLALGLAMGSSLGEARAFVEELACGRPVMAFLNTSSSPRERAMVDGGRMDAENSCLIFTRAWVLAENRRIRSRIECTFGGDSSKGSSGPARQMQLSMRRWCPGL